MLRIFSSIIEAREREWLRENVTFGVTELDLYHNVFTFTNVIYENFLILFLVFFMSKLILNCFNLQPVVLYISAFKSKLKFTFLDWNASAGIVSNRQKNVMSNKLNGLISQIRLKNPTIVCARCKTAGANDSWVLRLLNRI